MGEQTEREDPIRLEGTRDFFDSWGVYRKLVIKQLEYLENSVLENKADIKKIVEHINTETKKLEEKLTQHNEEFDDLKLNYTELKTQVKACLWGGGILISLIVTYISSYITKIFGD